MAEYDRMMAQEVDTKDGAPVAAAPMPIEDGDDERPFQLELLNMAGASYKVKGLLPSQLLSALFKIVSDATAVPVENLNLVAGVDILDRERSMTSILRQLIGHFVGRS